MIREMDIIKGVISNTTVIIVGWAEIIYKTTICYYFQVCLKSKTFKIKNISQIDLHKIHILFHSFLVTLSTLPFVSNVVVYHYWI